MNNRAMKTARIEETIMSGEPLIVGSGLAGLLTAIELADSGLRSTVCTKSAAIASNTAMAQGGVAAVTHCSTFDSVDNHIKDTLKAGAGMSSPEVVRSILYAGNTLIRRLEHLGVRFDRTAGDIFSLSMEGGHSGARVLHRRDTTGSAISQMLIKKAKQSPGITMIEDAPVVSLTIDDEGRCRGAVVLVNGSPVHVWASCVVLATGGLGGLYSRTTNPRIATGDGVALAYLAGAKVVDMEFVQFHPTALMLQNVPAFLISEAVRGAGARLLDMRGKRFAQRFHNKAELATRDIVARAIQTVMQEQHTHHVWLDMRSIKGATSKFPNIVAQCRKYGINPVSDLIPVAPAAHYSMGGVLCDLNGQTSIEGLYAIGECACVGLHGANRLASNSLLEAGVMALNAAKAIAQRQHINLFPAVSSTPTYISSPVVFADPGRLPQLLYDSVGLCRDESGLTEFLYKVSGKHKPAEETNSMSLEQANMLLVGSLIAESARARQESRGSHWRNDFPKQNDAQYLKRYYQSLSGNGWLDITADAGGMVLSPVHSVASSA